MAMRGPQSVSARSMGAGGGMMSPPNGAGMSTPPHKGTLPPGTKVQVGQITVTVQKYLSEGGFAHVYLVKTNQPIPLPAAAGAQPGAEYTHVLKRMAVPDKDMLAHVRGEVEIHRALRSHPNLVHFIEACATALPGGGYEVFILMEFCSGGGLIDMMNAHLRTRLSEPDVLRIFCDVASGLSAMHHSSPPLMHRDLKVENVLLSPAPGRTGGVTYKLCDFGSAKQILSRRAPRSVDEVRKLEEELNRTTTLQYRAPEMVDVGQRRVIDEKADVWAMGVLLYKLCYYTTPFEENGGGPLAILNARYRFPSAPSYSQGVKALIASMLQEQSSSRPSIDELIVRAHKLLGTPPPASVVHYAQLVANGKVVSELPSVKTASGRELDADAAARALRPGKAQVSAAAEVTSLIDMAPSKEELARLEQQEREKRAEAITPMRRGRPGKTAPTAGNVAPVASTPQNEFPDFSSKDLPLAATSAGGFSDTFVPSPSLGFGDSFAPSPAQTPAIMSKGAQIDRLQVEDADSGARTTPLSHSPALPGFSASPPSRISPVPSPLPLASTSDVQVLKRKEANNEATSRFPSVEELDARYAPAPSDQGIKKKELPGISSRPTVGTVASRFGAQSKMTPSSTSTQPAPNTGASLSSRWPPLAGENDSTSPSAPSGSTVQRSQTAIENRHSVADFARKRPTWEQSGSARSPKDLPAAPSLPARKPMPKDWLADATNEDRSSAPSSYESTAAAAKSKLSAPVEIAEPASYRSPARFGKGIAVEIPSKGRTSDDSSGEDEGPEDAAPARRPVSMLSPPSVQATPVSRHAPGRVQAPSWLVSDTDTSRLRGDAGAKLHAPTSASSSPRPTAISPTAEAPPSPRPEGQEERVPAAGTTAVARAPAWDEDDEEQRAMPFDKSEGTSRLADATAAAKSTVSAAVGKLIDFGSNSRHTSAEYPSTDLPTTTIDHGISPYSPSVAKFGNLSISDVSSQAAAVTEKTRASASPLRQSEDNGSSRNSQSAMEVNGNSDAKSTSSVDATGSAARNADPDPSSASSEDFMKRFPAMDVETAEREIRARASPLPAQRSDSRPISEVGPKASAKVMETRGEKSPLTGSKALASRTPEPRIIKPQARPAPKVTPGFVRERQKSLTGGSQRPASVDLAPPLPHTRGPRLPGFAGRQDDEQRHLAPAPASKAPVKTGPLKPWEREAVEREAADRSSVVRNQAGASSGASSPASHPGEPGQSDAAPEAYSGVSKLVSQWQQNASRGAPGWGRVGATADPRRANEAKLFHDAARHIAARDVDGLTPSQVTSHERGAVTGGIVRSATVAEGIVGNASRRAGRDV